MSNYVSYRDGGKTGEEGLFKWLGRLFSSGVPTTFSTTSLKVTQRAAGANLSVDVAIGDASIAKTDYNFWVWSDAINNKTVTAADVSNPRRDIVVAYVDLAVVDSTSSNNPGALKFMVVAGTAAASPSDPSGATIQAAVGAGNPYTSLSRLSIPAGAANVVDAYITDLRAPITLQAPVESATAGGWTNVTSTPTSTTYNGNGSYTWVWPSSVAATQSVGMRRKATRTVVAPTQCTSLNGTTQYYNRTTTITGMTWTDDFASGAWIKPSAYAAGVIISRNNGSSGWSLELQSTGVVLMIGYNAGASNARWVASYQAVPTNKWTHVAAQLDMSAHTATPTTSYVMFNGLDVPAAVVQNGTFPTALVQAGNLEVGSQNGGTTPFSGKLAQVFVSSAKITQANIRTLISQGLTSALITTHSIASAYSFDNSITDLNTTNANNLTAQGSAVATTVDSPFGNLGVSSSLEYGISTSISSDGLTETVQVPEGCALPTSGGVSLVSYSTQKTPYGFPSEKSKWRISSPWRTSSSTTSNATYGSWQSGGWALTVPTGDWDVGWQGDFYNNSTTSAIFNIWKTALTGMTIIQGNDISPFAGRITSPSAAAMVTKLYQRYPQSLTSASTYVMYTFGATTLAGTDGTVATTEIFAEFNGL